MSRSRIDRAGPDDVLNLAVDRGRVPFHIAALLVLDDRVPAEIVRTMVAERAGAVPRLASRLHRPAPGGGRPVWVSVAAAEVDRVVGVRGVPLAGDGPAADPAEPAFLRAAEDLVLTRFDRSGPLWRAEVLARPDGAAAALVVVAHHVLADGLAGMAVLGALADGPSRLPTAEGGGGRRPGQGPVAARVPGWRELAADAWRERLTTLRATRDRAGRLRSGMHSLGGGRPRLAEPSSLLARGSSRRRFDVARCELSRLHEAARAQGATVNDLVVASVADAVGRLVRSRGEHLAELVVSVPVSARSGGEAADLGNAVGAVPVRVPLHGGDDERVRVLVAAHDALRGHRPGSTASVLTPVMRGLAAVGVFQAAVDRQRLVHTFVTNVRGPATALTVARSAVREVVPVATNPGNVTVSFDALSYDGSLVVTVVSDPRHVPEAPRLAADLEAVLRHW
ncbi:MAG TPA: wax ester/triacylglycerol synthase domain-containing protein [Phycicoccus sp.]|nr:wax ester/triacylglycerol synthase domain-containing protein [Phycicoccus sp.]